MVRRKTFRSKAFGTELNECIFGVQEWNLDLRQFAIYLTGEKMEYNADNNTDNRDEPGVEYQMSARFLKNLNILSDIDSKRPILVHMKTCGGDWTEGMAIYDVVKYATNPIVILNYTHARSMSSIIFQAASRRIMMPHSYFLFHDGTMAVSATYRGFHSNADWSRKEHPVMLDIYATRMKEKGKYSKMSKADIKKMLEVHMEKKEDVFLTAQQAVDWGLADAVFDGNWQKLRQRVKR